MINVDNEYDYKCNVYVKCIYIHEDKNDNNNNKASLTTIEMIKTKKITGYYNVLYTNNNIHNNNKYTFFLQAPSS